MRGTLLHRGTVIPVDGTRRVLKDHSVAIAGDGSIEALGPWQEMEQRFAQYQQVDCQNHCILPGLIDCHGHTGHSMIRGLSRESPAYWNDVVRRITHFFAGEAFWRYDGLLSATDRARNGVTCCLNILERGEGLDLFREGELIAESYAQVGVRTVLSAGPGTHRYERVPQPESMCQWERDVEAAERLLRRFEGDDKIGVFVGPSSMVMSKQSRGRISPEYCHSLEEMDHLHLRTLTALARKYGTGIQVNCCGNLVELMATSPDAFLGPHVILSHCHHLTMWEMQIIAESRTNVGRSPEASLAYCPYSELLFRGVNVVLTSDSTGVVSSYDQLRNTREIRMVEEWRQHGQKPDAWQTLESITRNAARALLRGDSLGSLEAGKQADVITLAMDQPHLHGWQNDPVEWIMSRGRGTDVTNVWVAGQPVVRDGKCVAVDEVELAKRATQIALETVKPSGLESLWMEPAWGTVYRLYGMSERLPITSATI